MHKHIIYGDLPGGFRHRNHGFHFTGIAVSYDRIGGVTGAGILIIDRCVCYLDPIDIGNLDQIWWRLNSFVQTLLQHCEVFNVKVDDLTVDLIHDYLDNESPWRPGKDDSAGGNDDGQTNV